MSPKFIETVNWIDRGMRNEWYIDKSIW
jgi:hypothetical protein